MRHLDPSAVLPEFAATGSETDSELRELAELFAELSRVEVSEASASALAQGRARLLDAVNAGSERFLPFLDRLTDFFDLSADALRTIFERAADLSQWEAGPAPWISLLHFSGGPRVAGLDTGFVRFQKGTAFPPHRHTGRERVLILSGGYHDQEGRFYGPGALHDMALGTEHALQMGANEDVWLAVIIEGEVQVIGAP